MSESDGIEDAVGGGFRAGLMAAARIGEQLARMREQQQRHIQQAEELRARELQDRFDASQAAARAQLDPTSRNDWWDKATPEMIERAHETAEAWKGYDPVAAEHAETIKAQIQDRYGIDVHNPGATEQGISSALAQAQTARHEADNERSKAAAARNDEVLAGAAVAGANREDRTRHSSPSEPAYDSPERREQLARSLDGHPDREAVNARLAADQHQGTPPSAAVSSKPTVGKTSLMKKPPAVSRPFERGLKR
ncbi:hypothetical protein ACIQXM_17875 [Arthrobacter sp. NPDC097144]|uniref:hypothetical protein n=1 Tax=Arthrobacter sp. NPDC097144 TaxID=3363946 RepID=UPI0037FF72C5